VPAAANGYISPLKLLQLLLADVRYGIISIDDRVVPHENKIGTYFAACRGENFLHSRIITYVIIYYIIIS